MSIVHDVAVVGGGIAGAAAVLSLAQVGLSTLWIRPTTISADVSKVGESLAPAANPILSALGILDLLNNHHHRKANVTFSAWGQAMLVERNSVIHLEGAGHIIDRARFERDLVQLASEVCSTVLDSLLTGVEEADGLWVLSTDYSEGKQAKFVIDASGRSQIIGKFFSRYHDLSVETDDHLVAAYAFMRQKENSEVMVTPATLIESVPDGWWYASLLPSNQLTLNYYSDPDLMPRGLSSDLDEWQSLIQQTNHIAYWLEDAEFIIDRPPKLASAATRWLSSAAGLYNGQAGWAAIGDAAVAFDPLSAHGMTTALWAAARMSDVVSSYLEKDYSILYQYAEAVEQGRKDYLTQRNTIYAQEKRFSSCEFWQRRGRKG
ncbi:hypothetical protein C0J08_15790 [Marinomonas sp. CT5]|uniref:glycine oxidase maturase GoxB n=1 Tax=Marinomonas sp. CT5 TaxID=2066133 RepID=UPI001BB0A107|nr:glycine oxidase maturase GoxB [Marinomonas sp. CT5]QUX96770.1 hypothetical protein C0J08_15790 [Marinomonas sp. CT5]